MRHLRTERGFIIPSDEKTNKLWYNSPAINALYHEQCDILVNKLNWSWLGKAAEICAKQLAIDGKKNFFAIQLDSDGSLPFRAVDYVIDSMTYLRTGRRRISIDHWFDLLEVQPEKFISLSNEQLRRYKEEFKDILNLSPVELVCLWLSKPEGLDDLITSMMIIFGDSEKVED